MLPSLLIFKYFVAQQFRSLLGNAPELRPLLNKANTLSELQRQFASVSPPYFSQSCMVLGLNFGTLSIAVANPTVAAKLRHLAPELVVLLQNKGCEVSGIRVKVQVAYSSAPPPKRPRELSKTARSALDELGSNMDDSPLKQALQRMARKTP